MKIRKPLGCERGRPEINWTDAMVKEKLAYFSYFQGTALNLLSDDQIRCQQNFEGTPATY